MIAIKLRGYVWQVRPATEVATSRVRQRERAARVRLLMRIERSTLQQQQQHCCSTHTQAWYIRRNAIGQLQFRKSNKTVSRQQQWQRLWQWQWQR